jgi:hypothetical protein
MWLDGRRWTGALPQLGCASPKWLPSTEFFSRVKHSVLAQLLGVPFSNLDSSCLYGINLSSGNT